MEKFLNSSNFVLFLKLKYTLASDVWLLKERACIHEYESSKLK